MDILPQLVLNSVIAGAIYALIAISFNLIYGATKFFNFTHGVIAVAGAYGFLFFSKTIGLNFFFKPSYRHCDCGNNRLWTGQVDLSAA